MKRSGAIGSWVRVWRRALALGVVVACGGSVGGPTAGGESHFLMRCEASCEGGLSCISGVCTRGCVLAEGDCTGLAADAVCTDQSGEPGAVAVCDVACEGDPSCASLGDGYTCAGGFCRAGAPVAPGGASCRVLHTEYPSGSDAPMPNGCATCLCEDGELVSCDPRACPATGVPVFECTPGMNLGDPIDVQASRIEGDKLVLRVGHGGGCERHDYGLCYVPRFNSSYPPQAAVQLIHDAHDDACDAYVTSTLEFDLSNLAAESIRVQPNAGRMLSLRASTSGGDVTNYGLYAFGELSCEGSMPPHWQAPRVLAADAQVELAYDFADRTCATDEDCRVVNAKVSCSSVGCAYAVNASEVEPLRSWVQAIEERVCGEDFASACPAEVRGCVTSDVTVACRENECVITD